METFDPYAASAEERLDAMSRIRAEGGIVDTPVGRYVATAAGVSAGLRDVEKFVGSFIDTADMDPDDVPISAIPEPEHGRIRRVINSVVAPHRTHQAEPFIRDLCATLVDDALREAEHSGSVDLISTVSDPLPSSVIAHMLGAPVAMQRDFQRWSDELLQVQTTAAMNGGSGGHPEFTAFLQSMIDDRRANDDPPDDVVTRFINTDIDGAYLSDRMIRTQVQFLIVAGNETTRNLISHCFHRLAVDPDLLDVLRAEPDTIDVFVEEILRLEAPVQILARAVLDDTEITGCPMRVGDRVVFGLAAANRDPAVHIDPDAFRLDRPSPRDHLAFGGGPHICPGATLARLETRLLLEALIAAVSAIRLIDDFVPQPNPVFWANGHTTLPVVIEPA
ncbi:MAG: cytochrome P450 [Actinomycetota bacterium]